MASLFLSGSGRSLPQSVVGSKPIAGAGRYLAELGDRLRGFAASLRARRQHGDQLEAEVCLDVVADAAAEQGRVGRLAHRAQVHDQEAARILAAAQAPDSPGGRLITPDELRPALRLINLSADDDRQITEACQA